MTNICTDHIPESVAILSKHLHKYGGKTWLVGGSVRDILLGKKPKDSDVEIYGLDGETVAKLTAELGRTQRVGKQFGVIKLWLHGNEIDIALPRTERKTAAGHRGFDITSDPYISPETATLRRDFTINAMMYDPLEDHLLDFHQGVKDLANGILRHVSPAFSEDPLRVLRGMQFAARFKLILHPDTAKLCHDLLPEAETLSSSRIWQEWQKWAHAPTPSFGLQVLQNSGWLKLYPELELMIDCPQDIRWHPEGDVWNHTCLVTDQAARVADDRDYDTETREQLVFAALCHDLGKPSCTFTDKDGSIRSPGHAEAGKSPTHHFLKSIRAPKQLEKFVHPLVREHLVHLHGEPTPRAIRRLANRLAPTNIELWEALVEADASGRFPYPASRAALPWLKHAQDMQQHQNKPQAIMTGKMLIQAGINSGPEMGKILKHAFNAQLEGDFNDTASAHSWLQQYLSKQPHQLS
ncbi:MAG: HD domain-containing protein [Mariprofundaceae bacterium]